MVSAADVGHTDWGGSDGDAGRFDASRQLSSTLKMPAVSCRSWLVSDAVTGRPLLWHRPLETLQPASITKVVTALVVLDYIEKQGKAAGKGAKAAKTTKTCAAREQKTKLLETACSVSRYGASFAGWMAGYGWNAGTNAQLKAQIDDFSLKEKDRTEYNGWEQYVMDNVGLKPPPFMPRNVALAIKAESDSVQHLDQVPCTSMRREPDGNAGKRIQVVMSKDLGFRGHEQGFEFPWP